MKFNVTLDKEQLEEIARLTADKVLTTVKYCNSSEENHKREIKRLEKCIRDRDAKIVQKELFQDRIMSRLRETRIELETLKESTK